MWCRFTLVVSALVMMPGWLRGADTAPVALDPIEVTGTRLGPAADSGVLPVFRFSPAEIELLGTPSTGELLRALPFNAGTMLSNSSVTGLNGAHQGVNLRGLGNGATLVLVNGMRLPSFPQADPFVFSADVGNLPTAAVESIEVLKDGASAIYGSDAIAGVINIKLKRSYTGGSLRVGFQDMEGTNWHRRTASLTLGRSDAVSSFMVAVDYAANGDVRFSERRVSRTEDLRWLGGQDLRSDWTMPGQVQVPVDAVDVPMAWVGNWVSIGSSQDGVVSRGGPTSDPQLADFIVVPEPVVDGVVTPGDSRRFYDENADSSMIPAESARGTIGTWVRHFRGDRELSIDWGWRHRVTTMTLPPPRVVPGLDSRAGDGPDGQLIIPATNPYNPFGVDLHSYAFLLTDLGLRQRRFTNDVPRVAAAWRNPLGETWVLEVHGQWAENRVREEATNVILTTDVQAGLAGRAGGWINPFGPSDPALIDSLRTSYRIDQSFATAGGAAVVRGRLGKMDRLATAIALGAEARHENYDQLPGDEAIATGAHASWDPFPRLDLQRTTTAAFAEAVTTWGDVVDVQLALRGDHYSDFGGAVKPKLALAWRPRRWLTMRAGRSQAYRAPDLLQLLPQPKTGTVLLTDPRRPDLGTIPVTVVTAGNPDLRPENSTTDTIGIQLHAPADSGWRFSADWWRIQHRDRISYAGTNSILMRELDPTFPSAGLIERFSSEPDGRPGALYAINDQLINIREVTVTGIDGELSWRGALFGGRVDARLVGTHLASYRRVHPSGATDDIAGKTAFPRWRANAVLGWQRDSWSVGWAIDWIGRHDGVGINYRGGSVNQHARAFQTVTVARNFADDWKVTLQLANVFDTDPPVFYEDKRGYLTGVYPNRGRTYGVFVERTW